MSAATTATTFQKRPKVSLLIESSNAFARGILSGIRDYVHTHGPWNVDFLERSRSEEPAILRKRWKGDGIMVRAETPAIAAALPSTRVPVVDLSSHGFLPNAPVVTTDNVAIAQHAFAHFRERGFQHFAFCGEGRFPWAVARGETFAKLVREAGSTCSFFPGSDRGDSPTLQTDAIARWLGTLPIPCAVFACYDARGQQVLDACQRVGLSVPEQMAVLGCDNDELLCALSPLPLSSVIPDTHRAGWFAAEMLDRMMRGAQIPPIVHRIPPVGVATRQSTDIHAVDDPQLARALAFIREHACQGIRVSDILDHCPMSRRLLEHRMQTFLGRSPHEEIIRLQIQRARELLSSTELSLADIAERCGFRHAEYLSVAFKRKTGLPPSEYRRLYHHPAPRQL